MAHTDANRDEGSIAPPVPSRRRRALALLGNLLTRVMRAIEASQRRKADLALRQYAHLVREGWVRQPLDDPETKTVAPAAPVQDWPAKQEQPQVVLWRRRPAEDEGRRRRRRP